MGEYLVEENFWNDFFLGDLTVDDSEVSELLGSKKIDILTVTPAVKTTLEGDSSVIESKGVSKEVIVNPLEEEEVYEEFDFSDLVSDITSKSSQKQTNHKAAPETEKESDKVS